MACKEHNNRPPCHLEHSKPKMDNTKRLWGTVIKYIDEERVLNVSSNYKSINGRTIDLK